MSACGTVAPRVDVATATELAQRCAGYRLTLDRWEEYRLAGGTMTPERQAIVGGLALLIASYCGPAPR